MMGTQVMTNPQHNILGGLTIAKSANTPWSGLFKRWIKSPPTKSS
jgi:hypothetical protein